VIHGVTIIGEYNLAAMVPYHASQMYARNVTSFLLHLTKEGKLQLNLQDEIMRETLLTHEGEIVNARAREFFRVAGLADDAGGRRRPMKLDLMTGLYVFMLAAFYRI